MERVDFYMGLLIITLLLLIYLINKNHWKKQERLKNRAYGQIVNFLQYKKATIDEEKDKLDSSIHPKDRKLFNEICNSKDFSKIKDNIDDFLHIDFSNSENEIILDIVSSYRTALFIDDECDEDESLQTEKEDFSKGNPYYGAFRVSKTNQPLTIIIKNDSDQAKVVDIFNKNIDPTIQILYSGLELSYERFMHLISDKPFHAKAVRIVVSDIESSYSWHNFLHFDYLGRSVQVPIVLPFAEIHPSSFQSHIIDKETDITINGINNKYNLKIRQHSSVCLYFFNKPLQIEKEKNEDEIVESVVLENTSDEDQIAFLFNDQLYLDAVQRNSGLNIISTALDDKINYSVYEMTEEEFSHKRDNNLLNRYFNRVKCYVSKVDKEKSSRYNLMTMKGSDKMGDQLKFSLCSGFSSDSYQLIFDVKPNADILISSLHPVEVLVPANTKIAMVFYKMKNQN